jgi:hypothetical protein
VRGRAIFAAAALLLGCTRAPVEKSNAPEPAPSVAAEPKLAPAPPTSEPASAEQKPPAAPRAAQYRIAQQTGAATAERAPLGVRFTIPPDAAVSVDLVNGARVNLEADSRAWLLDAEPATIVLLSGGLHAQLPPQGSAAGRPALRIVTLGYALSIDIDAELWLWRPAARSGETAHAAYLAVLSGVADLERLDATPEAQIATQKLVAGQAFTGTAPPRTLATNGPRTLEKARAASTKLKAPRAEPPSVDDPELSLLRALEAWNDAQLRGKSLLKSQQEAKAAGLTPAVESWQTKLVAHAQEKLAIRSSVRLAYELACERALGRYAEANSDLARFEASYAMRVAPALPSGS